MYTVPIYYIIIILYNYVWERLKKTGPRCRRWYTAAATTTSHHNRWRQEQHDRRRRLWPRTASGVSACVRTPTSGVCVFLSVLRGRLKLSRSLFCGHTRTRTRLGSRVLDECAGSRASVYTHRRVSSNFSKRKIRKKFFSRSSYASWSLNYSASRPVFFHIIFISTTCTVGNIVVIILRRGYCSIRNTYHVKQFYTIGVSYATRAGSDFSTIRLSSGTDDDDAPCRYNAAKILL